MIARPATVAVPPRALGHANEALSWAAVPVGIALLLARPWLTGSTASLGLVATFAALAALSLAAAPVGATATVIAPARAPRARSAAALLPAWAALAVGGAAVAAAAVAGSLPGPAAPIRGGAGVLALVVGTAVAEEAFFRRLLYGRLARWGAPAAILGSAVAFGTLHVPLHGVAALPVDLGAGLFLSWQRWASGGWAAPAATHALANVVAVLR